MSTIKFSGHVITTYRDATRIACFRGQERVCPPDYFFGGDWYYRNDLHIIDVGPFLSEEAAVTHSEKVILNFIEITGGGRAHHAHQARHLDDKQTATDAVVPAAGNAKPALVLPANCVDVTAEAVRAGTVYGFVGAEAFRAALKKPSGSR